jgi:hypothetical protein
VEGDNQKNKTTETRGQETAEYVESPVTRDEKREEGNGKKDGGVREYELRRKGWTWIFGKSTKSAGAAWKEEAWTIL